MFIILAILSKIRANSLEVAKISALNKERSMTAHIQSIDLERKRQLRMITKLKAIEQPEGIVDEKKET